MNVKICHVTSAHGKEDTRIFKKECSSLARVGYDVYLVQQGESYEKMEFILLDLGKKKEQIEAFFLTARQAYKKAIAIDADIYQIHDPELLPYAKKMKKKARSSSSTLMNSMSGQFGKNIISPDALEHLCLLCIRSLKIEL